jgi:hypothetical protein
MSEIPNLGDTTAPGDVVERDGIEGLYWSIRGEVACSDHAPEPSSMRWIGEGWTQMPVSSRRRHGLEYQCQHCSDSGRPIAHSARDARAELSKADDIRSSPPSTP